MLSSNGTFKLTYGATPFGFVVGTYTQSGSSLELTGRSGDLQGDRLTLSYPGFDDSGAPVTVVELFTRYR